MANSLCLFVRLLMFFQVRREWQLIPFALTNLSEFLVFFLLAASKNSLYIHRDRMNTMILVMWTCALVFFLVSTVGYMWGIFVVLRDRRRLVPVNKTATAI